MTAPGQRPLLGVTVTFERGDDDAVARVSVAGEVDTFSAAVLREALIGLEERRPDRIVVDLGAVTFIDSAGIGVLVGALRRADDRDAALVVEHASTGIRRVFDMTHLSAAFGLDGGSPLAGGSGGR